MLHRGKMLMGESTLGCFLVGVPTKKNKMNLPVSAFYLHKTHQKHQHHDFLYLSLYTIGSKADNSHTSTKSTAEDIPGTHSITYSNRNTVIGYPRLDGSL